MTEPQSLKTFPVHLGLGASAAPQPEFTGLDWYEAYSARTADDGKEGRLIALHDFSESWTSWEMHPEGDEVVICISGRITLIQECEGDQQNTIALEAGDYAINAAGIWHTADTDGPASALFITAGAGTCHRPR